MASPETYLTKGPMPELSKMKQAEIKEECQMWRNIWGWVPPEVKYYVARIGQEIGVTQRNYKRYLGTLLDSHWTLLSLEVGTVDKVFDSVRDKFYWEKKIAVLGVGSILDIQWIKERKEFEQFEKELAEQIAKEEKEAKLKKE
jgi:hypothetical protein